MARVLTYGQLKTKVAETMHRGDLDDQMDNSIAAVEGEIFDLGRMVDIVQFQNLQDSDRWVSGSPEYAFSIDHTEIIEVYTGDIDVPGAVAKSSDVTGIRTLSDNAVWDEMRRAGTQVDPRHYSLTPEHTTIRFSPNPPEGTIFVVYFFGKNTAMTTDLTSTALLITHPMIYVYGMCKHLSIFVQDMELADSYDKLMVRGIERANAEFSSSVGPGPIQIEGTPQFC